MKKIGAMLILAAFAVACGESEGGETSTSHEVQVVQVSVEGSEYLFSPAAVQAGIPVKLEFDVANLPGCSNSITLAAYEITKVIEEADATIEFTPRDEGPIEIACTMNMFKGSLAVE